MEYAKLLADAKLNPIEFNLYPFSPKEVNAIKDWLQKSRAGQQENGATVADKYWREIHAAAQLANISKSFEDEALPPKSKQLGQKNKIDQLANTSKSFEATPPKRNRLGQKLERIATALRPKNMSINSAVVAALAFGASRLELITYPRTANEFTLRKKLCALSHEQINDSAAQAMKEPLVRGGLNKTPLLSSDKGGRPSEDALNYYIAALLKIHSNAIKLNLPTNSWGELAITRANTAQKNSVVDFVDLCLPKETFGVMPIALIRKAVIRVRQSIK